MEKVEANGWAIVERGELLVATVSPTPLGAMVNWLVVRARVMVTNGWPDALVKRAFEERSKQVNATLREVSIAAK